MSAVRVVSHPACRAHPTPSGHPERSERLDAVLEAVAALPAETVEQTEAPRVTDAEVARVHPDDYWRDLQARQPAAGAAPLALDPDTWLGHGSIEAARRAAGAVCEGVRAVLASECESVFCAVRPPGHHAEAAHAMGFCLINHVAIGATAALAAGLERVAVADFDVHHGNGTEAIFRGRSEVLYLSSHQSPLYPGTGTDTDTGPGRIVNAPLPPGADGRAFRRVWRERLLPVLRNFQPQLLLISAGFDGHRLDPLAQLELATDDYRWITAALREAMSPTSAGVVSTLEGGYHPDALRACTAAHLRALAQ